MSAENITPSKKVRLYGLSTCPSCSRLKGFLDSNGIAYEHIVVDLLDGGEQWAATKELKRFNPEASYPTLVIEEAILGFDEGRIREALGIK